MRNVINTIANVTTVAIANRTVAVVMAGVDVLRARSSDHLRFYHAAPAPQRWAHKFAGKQKPAGTGPSLGSGSELSRCSRREMSRCRRPRVSSCLARS